MSSNVLPLHLKQTFLPIIWIFTEGEGDGIKSRLLFKIFSTSSQTISEKSEETHKSNGHASTGTGASAVISVEQNQSELPR